MALLFIYLIGVIGSLFLSPMICSVNPDTGKPINALVHFLVALGWPLVFVYLTASVFTGTGDDDDDNEMGS